MVEYYIVEDGVRVGFFSDQYIEKDEYKEFEEVTEYLKGIEPEIAKNNRDKAFRKYFVGHKSSHFISVSNNLEKNQEKGAS